MHNSFRLWCAYHHEHEVTCSINKLPLLNEHEVTYSINKIYLLIYESIVYIKISISMIGVDIELHVDIVS